MARPAADRTQLFIVVLAVVLYLGHYLVYTWPQPFYIEDSAISFSYARNLVEGEGLVAYPGGERVEGYSNALWTFLVAGLYAIGVPVWTSAKLMGAGFGAATLFFVWALARRARPGAADPLVVAAPILLACSTQFVLWNASGLENSLFNLLLAAGMWALTCEIQDNRRAPWSAVCFALLTMTRPEGLAYASLGVLARVLGTLARRQWLALPLWGLAFGLIYGSYNAWRYEYFGWWYPNTYYAKERVFRPFLWAGGSWKQVKEYFLQYGILYASPLLLAALTGLRSRRRWVGVGLLAGLAVLLLWDGRTGIPTTMAGNWSRVLGRTWNDARVWYLLGGSIVLGLLTLGRRGWEARGMLWGSLCAGVFFCVWAQGDWMRGLRFFSQTSVPLFTLLGVGIGALAAGLPFASYRIAGWLPVKILWAAPMVIALAVPNVNGSWTFANNPETAPRDVHKRVRYMTWVQNRLGLEHVTLLDVDMGAHLWYSGWDIVDIAGLVDVPISHHRRWQKEFIEDYIFDEKRPDFAHVHGAWAKTSKIDQHARWDPEYVEIPGFPSGRRALHVGNHVRRDHLVGSAYVGPAERRVDFAGGIALEGWELPSPSVAAGGKLYVRTTWRAEALDAGFRVLAFLSDAEGHLHSAEVAPGYDWYRPERWTPADHVYGRWSIGIPESLPEGRYDFGFVVLDQATGEVRAHVPDPSAAGAAEGGSAAPRFMVGEWRAEGVVEIVAPPVALNEANTDNERALSLAVAGKCEDAQEAFRDARRHVARNDRWYLAHVDALEAAVVACLVARAESTPDVLGKTRVLAQARLLDHRAPALVAATEPVAAALVAAADTARLASNWEDAYRGYAAALTIVPTLSHVRRIAEEMRDLRLGIDGQEGPPGQPLVPPAKDAVLKKPAKIIAPARSGSPRP